MRQRRGSSRDGRRARTVGGVTGLLAAATILQCCHGSEVRKQPSSAAVLRVGVGQYSATNPLNGLRQINQLLALESLARAGDDGRMQPWVAESWTLGPDGKSVRVKLRSHVSFHDGSAANAEVLANLLPNALRSSMGPVFPDFDHAAAIDHETVEIGFKHPSPFLLESLEVQVVKPGTPPVGTGPFVMVPASTDAMSANADYYMGRPSIGTISVESFPSIRTAWAEMLRDRLDVLWEVGPDALESLTNSNSISVFTFTRRYQHVIAFNPKSAAVRPQKVRQALSIALDRAAIVRNALRGYGVPSSGPIWPHYWAVPNPLPQFNFEPQAAAAMLRSAVGRPGGGSAPFRLSCLTTPDSISERIALEVKRQLQAVGVDMTIEAVSQDQLMQRATKGAYDAVLIEAISGPTLIRPYLVWHSGAPINWGGFDNPTVDAALDRVRNAPNEPSYREAVAGLQRAFIDDPPAIFLAWSQRARAVSKRFDVPPAESGRDILSNLRMWKPSTTDTRASRN
jgi:peptide/nickel transport system substrate-binding protein